MIYTLGLTNSDRLEESYYLISPTGHKIYLDISERGDEARKFLDELNRYLAEIPDFD